MKGWGAYVLQLGARAAQTRAMQRELERRGGSGDRGEAIAASEAGKRTKRTKAARGHPAHNSRGGKR